MNEPTNQRTHDRPTTLAYGRPEPDDDLDCGYEETAQDPDAKHAPLIHLALLHRTSMISA